jgi:hypothetical protein
VKFIAIREIELLPFVLNLWGALVCEIAIWLPTFLAELSGTYHVLSFNSSALQLTSSN